MLVSLRSLAGLYTDSLWFSSVDLHNVFSTLLAIKLGLFGVFGAIFFAVLWVNLVVCDRIAGRDIVLAQEDELVRRYQQFVRPYAGRIYVGLAFVLALIGASGTVGQWNNWILFRHGGNFGVTDPQFHKDIGFYVFDLPFLTFVVDWTLAILIVTLAVSVVFHYFNGGIQPQRGVPRVRPPVKAHISVLLALIALDKAAGYVLQRWSLVNSQDGYVNGAGYTDVHARLPAETLLIYVSIFAAVILLFNIRRQGWTFPVLAIGIWAFVALVVGIIYPALLQALKVTPAQSSLEAPYINRNITATRDAYGLNNVTVHQFPASHEHQRQPDRRGRAHDRQHPAVGPGPDDLAADVPAPAGHQVLLRVPLIGRGPLHPERVAHAGVDRRARHLGLRCALPVVGQHAPPVHPRERGGGGAVQPDDLQQPGLRRPGRAARVIERVACNHPTQCLLRPGRDRLCRGQFQAARSRLPEEGRDERREPLHGDRRGAAVVDLHPGRLRAAAGRLQPPDLEPDHGQVAHHVHPGPGLHGEDGGALPHLRPRPLRGDQQWPGSDHGHIDWVVDGYTTTANYAYSQNADTQQVAVGSNLPGSYNYVRNSVKVVIDAYSGKMTFYDADPSDPILKAYSAAFPNMFTPISKMPAALQAHLRYPPDIFSIQSAIYGRYHLTNSGQFYAASNAWQLSPTAGAGPQSQALLAQNTYNNQGQLVSTTPARMSPQYQVYSLPGTAPAQQLFTVSDAFVPASQTNLSGNNQNFNLTAWMVGLADPGHYGQLNLYETPQGTAGPANADAEISANKTVSSDITLLDQHGSEVLLGETLMVPIANSMVYLRPLYASPTTNPQPQLQYVVGVLGKTVQIDTSLSAVLSDLLQTTVSLPSESGVSSTGTVPLAVAGLLQQAQTDYTNALAALKAEQPGSSSRPTST